MFAVSHQEAGKSKQVQVDTKLNPTAIPLLCKQTI